MRASTHEPSERLRSILDRAQAGGGTVDPPPVLTTPSVVAQSRWQVSRRAVVGAGVVLLAAVAVLLVRTEMAQRAAEPVPVAATSPGAAATGVTTGGDRSAFATSAPSTSQGAASAAPSGEVYVHVVGRVRSPGVVRVAAGSRVADAVTKAGGVSASADVAQVNLARVVVDGEQIVVPRQGEQLAAGPGAQVPGTATAPGGAASGNASGTGLVPLNTADQVALESLPGVGPVLAARIIEWREANGGFTTVEELHEVSGIGEKLFAQISPKVTV